MQVPERFRRYHCEDYFAGGWADRGHIDERSQTLVIAPVSQAYERKEKDFFAIGRSGWGGIDFGYRVGQVGLWAYYPIGGEFKFMAPTVADLVQGYCSGKLSV
jgi:hypothetical protein